MVTVVAVGCALLVCPALAQKKKEPPKAAHPQAQKKDAAKKDELGLNAPHAILIEAKSGSVLYEKNPDQLIYPASLGKLMTTEYVFHLLKTGKIKLTDEYIGERARLAHGRRALAQFHDVRRAQQQGAGRRADPRHDHPVGQRRRHYSRRGHRRQRTRIRRLLTKRAREIGLSKSTFTNSNGLPDPGEQVTTRELAMLARRIILDYPEYYPIFAQPDFTWNKIHQQNRNPLLASSIGADGLKTGFTKEAGYGLVGSAVENGLRLIVVVNGEKTANDRAREGKKLLEWGFRNFEERALFAEGETLGSAKVYGGANGSCAAQGRRRRGQDHGAEGRRRAADRPHRL